MFEIKQNAVFALSTNPTCNHSYKLRNIPVSICTDISSTPAVKAESIENAPASTAESPVQQYVRQFSILAAKTALATLEMCKVVHDAKSDLSKGDFNKFCAEIGRSDGDSTIRKYLAIGEAYPRLIDCADRLPNSWTSIYSITQIPPDKFTELLDAKNDFKSFTGVALKQLIAGADESSKQKVKAPPSAHIYFKKEPSVAEWNYFKAHLMQVIDGCEDLALSFEATPRYKKLIKDLKAENRQEAKADKKRTTDAAKKLEERDVYYRPDLFDYDGAFDKEKGEFV
jgi:hypothetical protein